MKEGPQVVMGEVGGIRSLNESQILANIGYVYSEANMIDEAENYYRQALVLDPKNPLAMNDLAWLLIDNDVNINEGVELVDSALKFRPNNYSYLHCKGWGLYKQGKYQEALEMLQKGWDLRMKNAIYDHEAFHHLEAAKKAIAYQKND